MSRRPVVLLVNPVAGRKLGSGPSLANDPADLEADALADALRRAGLEVRLHELAETDDLTALAADAVREGNDVVVAGGDGTVGAAAAALVGTDATLGVLPMGSFNNVARGLDVPRRLNFAVQVIADGRASPVDAGRAQRAGDEPSLFFEAAGVGMDAALFGAADAGNRHGILVALRRAWRALRWRRQPIRIVVDDGPPMRTSALFVTVSNGPYYGFGFTVADNADVRDGKFEISIFTRMSKWEVIRHFLAVARGRHRYEPRIRRILARRVRLEGIRRELPAHVDGRPIGPTPVTFEILHRALRVYRDPELARQAALELGET